MNSILCVEEKKCLHFKFTRLLLFVKFTSTRGGFVMMFIIFVNVPVAVYKFSIINHLPNIRGIKSPLKIWNFIWNLIIPKTVVRFLTFWTFVRFWIWIKLISNLKSYKCLRNWRVFKKEIVWFWNKNSNFFSYSSQLQSLMKRFS